MSTREERREAVEVLLGDLDCSVQELRDTTMEDIAEQIAIWGTVLKETVLIVGTERDRQISDPRELARLAWDGLQEEIAEREKA